MPNQEKIRSEVMNKQRKLKEGKVKDFNKTIKTETIGCQQKILFKNYKNEDLNEQVIIVDKWMRYFNKLLNTE